MVDRGNHERWGLTTAALVLGGLIFVNAVLLFWEFAVTARSGGWYGFIALSAVAGGVLLVFGSYRRGATGFQIAIRAAYYLWFVGVPLALIGFLIFAFIGV